MVILDHEEQSRYPRIHPNKIPTEPIIIDSRIKIRRTEASRIPSDFMIAMSWRFSWVIVEMMVYVANEEGISIAPITVSTRKSGVAKLDNRSDLASCHDTDFEPRCASTS